MATRRRVRITTGFGQGGRGALLGSLLPTAQDNADAKAVLQIQDNEKVTAFNNDELTYAQIEAYFNDRLAHSTDSVDKARVQSMLTSAKTANDKKAQAAAVSAVKSALDSYQNGDGDYESVISAIEAADKQVQDQSAKDALTDARRGAHTIQVSRKVTAAINDYNNGGSYADNKKVLQDVLASETNEQVKTQIGTSLKTMREAENNRVMTLAANQYATDGDINMYITSLQALRDSPDQTNPDSISKISAAIEQGVSNEQMAQDSKMYTAWQTHQISDEDALRYFQGRLATARNPKEVDYLGKYAANVQQGIDAANKAAAGRAASVARGASAASTAAIGRQDNLSRAEFDYFEKNTFKNMLEKAGSDPEEISKAYDIRKLILVGPDGNGGLVGQGGYYASEYALYAKLNEQERKDTISKVLWKDYTTTQAENLKATGITGANAPKVGEFTAKNLEIADKAAEIINGPYSNYFSDSQKKTAYKQRNDALQATQSRLDMEAAGRRTAEGTVEARIADLIYGNEETMAKRLGIELTDQEKAQAAINQGVSVDKLDLKAAVTQKLSDWILADPETRITQVYRAATAGTDKTPTPGEASKFTEDFMKVFRETQAGKIIGMPRDSEYTQSYVAFLQTAYPNSFRSVFANGQLLSPYQITVRDADGHIIGYRQSEDIAPDENSPDNVRAMSLMERMASQPFRGSEIEDTPAKTDNPKAVILDDMGEPARPQYNPVLTPVPDTNPQGVPYTPLMKGMIAFGLAMGDTFANADRFASYLGGATSEWFDSMVKNEIKGVGELALNTVGPGSPGDELGKLWEDTLGKQFSVAGTTYSSLWQDALKAKSGEMFPELTKLATEPFVAPGSIADIAGQAKDQAADQWSQFTQERAGQWQDLTAKKADDWSKFGLATWDGINHNIMNTWNEAVGMLGGALAAPPAIQTPTFGGWDAITTDAQRSIQNILNGASDIWGGLTQIFTPPPPAIPEYTPQTPGYVPPDYSVAPLPGTPEASFDQFNLPDTYNSNFDWSQYLDQPASPSTPADQTPVTSGGGGKYL
jgi:hypothetical protein